MGFNSQGNNNNNSNGTAFNARSSYNTRIRSRRDSLQQSSVAFSPAMGYNSPNGSSQISLNAGANSIYSHQPRLGYIWSGANVAGGSSRNRCLSTSSVDSNASSVGLSNITPALAAMSVQHNQQGSTTNSPYQSYSSSPQQGNFHNYYQQQSSSESSYPYSSPFSSPLSQSQVPTYDSLSIATTNIVTDIYGTAQPTHSGTDVMYSSPSPYNAARYGSSSISLAPSLYSEPNNTTGDNGTRAFEYADQYQQSQGQYYNQQTQQGLGIMATGDMVRGMSSSPENDDDEDGQQDQQQRQQQSSGMKRSPSMSNNLQSPDDIQAVIGKDGKTLVYICPKCDPSKVVEFTTKSNLKRHLENKNIHNTPYERRRDQKRWQGHEKKQVSRDETTLRMRKWRNCNPEKNRFNDMRCRVYRNARKIYGDIYSEVKEEYIRSEIERRKQNMIIRNSRRAEWVNQAAADGSPNNGSLDDSSESSSESPVSATAFMFNGNSVNPPSSPNDSSIKSGKQKPDESKFLQDLKENKLPPRRRSRSAMYTAPNNSSALSTTETATTAAVTLSENSFGSVGPYTGSLGADPFGYNSSTQTTRRLRKRRAASDNSDAYRQNQSQTFSNTGALGGYPSIVGGSYQGYMDSNQQLQMLEQKYSTGIGPQSLLVGKNDIQQQQQQQGQENLDTVVEAMEISQAAGLTGNENNNSNGATDTTTTGSTSVFYGDRDASAWLSSSATYNTQNLAGSAQAEDGSRGFPFPVIRDRKELARAAGVRVDIPQQPHPLAPNQWINGIKSGASADDMVSGSATSLESPALNRHDHSSIAGSPLSAALPSPMHGRDGSDDCVTNNNNNLNNGFRNNGYKNMMTKTKGSNFEVFGLPSVQLPLYGQSLSTSESGLFTTTDSTPMNENNYLAKDQGFARRHSTAMANLSYL
ncbi:hypothetical protein BGZ80_000702 [Entomortierella chlamydospora]|uniref:DUF3020 domain-containing protein n=1 Tax=Entomortierella chlamydospora TaxID=101097 RepID=A0A9P6SYA4_9FUNG|nr:hypothetical protein BGZ80_000702 [Entomortierella chlamydospora]